MVEIAICLAIIGIALVAIIGVLPAGLNVQKDNREETLIDQDATVFIENIRNGTSGLDDLTNYVMAITNTWTFYNPNGTIGIRGVNGYTYANATAYGATLPSMAITNGANIIGLLTMPEYTLKDGTPASSLIFNDSAPVSSLIYGGYSNYVVAYVRSLSGPAVEKPPQNNDIILSSSFSYKIVCQNVPVAGYTPPVWQAKASYNTGDEVLDQGVFWRATAATVAGVEPPASPWAENSYNQQLAANLRELRLTFLWPLLPNGTTGHGRQTFRTTVAGQLVHINAVRNALYFFQPQTFTSAP
jgi:type II secretory pathway pseudopilin PulG